MPSASRFPRRFVDNCNDHDVIFGRGKGSYNHPGNKQLQNAIRQMFPQYDAADLQTKTILAHKVVDVMASKNPPSRFLKPDKDANRWYEMTREEVVKKIKQDFANLKSAHKRKIEDDDEEPTRDRKRPAKSKNGHDEAKLAETTASMSLLEQCSAILGTEKEVQSEVSAIMAVVNQVFVHNPRLDHQKQAEIILSDDAVKEAIVSILEWKEERHTAILKGRIPISRSPASALQPQARLLQAASRSSSSASSSSITNSSTMPFARGLPFNNVPAVKPDVAQMESVCNKVHFEANNMDDINNITPKLRLKDDRTYSGSVMNSIPHGIGFMKYDDGRIYCGAWRKGKLHGNACVLYKNGDRYLGEFSKNKRIGEGVCYYNDGSIYQGRFENDRLHGKGAYRSRDGNVYEGEFLNGDFEGIGVHRRLDGTEQSGYFVNWELVSSEETRTETPGDGDNKDDEPNKDESTPAEKEETATEMDEEEKSQGSVADQKENESQEGTDQNVDDHEDPSIFEDADGEDDDNNEADGTPSAIIEDADGEDDDKSDKNEADGTPSAVIEDADGEDDDKSDKKGNKADDGNEKLEVPSTTI